VIEDIDATLRAVMDRQGPRDYDRFAALLERLAQAKDGFKLQWDPGAGEEWGRILSGPIVEALIHFRYPVAIVRSAESADLQRALADPSVVVVEVPDWEDETFSARLETVQEFAGHGLGWDFDADKFSAADLWFVSV
jgi:hypothetical protein